jgi:predicted MPP superfamily phosphohydrolase
MTTQYLEQQRLGGQVPATEIESRGSVNVRNRVAGFVAVVQLVLLLAHWFVYQTWVSFRGDPDPPGATVLQLVLLLLSVSFVGASLLAFRYSNSLVALLYRIAATWLGFFNFFFLAACTSWALYLGFRLLGVPLNRSIAAGSMFGLAAVLSIYGVINARSLRVKRITVKLPNIPATWRGRLAALVSDAHLGHVNGSGFMRRIVNNLTSLRPDIVFITGDLYDGSKVDAEEVAAPLRDLPAKFGAYFVTGNHEEFSSPTKYLDAIKRTGVGVLDNEKVIVDGLQIVGVNDRDSAEPGRFRWVLEHANIDRGRASILLSHSPHELSIAEDAGISLQLSGHTHGGQIFPFTWFTERIFGEYTHGLKRFGELMVYTSSGAGTWGPPMRVGTRPEIVLIQFA